VHETWKEVPGTNGFYEVSDLGAVRSWKLQQGGRASTPHPLRGTLTTRSGYPTFKIGRTGGTKLVHQAVLEAFVGPRPEGHVTRHLNDIKTDNRLVNLQWGTVQENHDDAKRNGIRPIRTGKMGTNNPQAKLTEDRVREMRSLRRAGQSLRTLGLRYGVSISTVSLVCNDEIWRHVL
jgi:hypothetical protein